MKIVCGRLHYTPHCRKPASPPLNSLSSGAMLTFSRDPNVAEKQMKAIIFYLTTFGYVDGHFDEVLAGIERDLGAHGRGTAGVLRAAIQVAGRDEGSARILTEQLALAARVPAAPRSKASARAARAPTTVPGSPTSRRWR